MHWVRFVSLGEKGGWVEDGGWGEGYAIVQQEAQVVRHLGVGHPSIRGLPEYTLQGMRSDNSYVLSQSEHISVLH